jgi:hypothetical protein
MKKILIMMLSATVAFALVGCDWLGMTTTTTTTTVSTEPDPTIYSIGTAVELAAVDPTKNYVLTANIDLNGIEWVPIGNSTTPYSGTFDGDGFTISDFVITHENEGYVGLFGNVTGDIQNLYLDEVIIDLTASRMVYAGVLAGYTTGNVTMCTTRADVTVNNPASTTYAGLLIGFSSSPITAATTAPDFIESVISQSASSGFLEVSSQQFAYVGGLIGKTYNVELDGCSAAAEITVSSEAGRIYAGGLVGHNYGGILVGFEDQIEREAYLLTSECVVRTKITVASRGTQASVGGLYGYDNYGHLEKCSAFLELSAAGLNLIAGGVSGENWEETVINSCVTILADFTEAEGQTLAFGGIAGYLENSETLQNSYYLLDSETVPTVTAGTAATMENYGSLSWYRDTLLWEYPADLPMIMWASSWLRRSAFGWE